MNVRGIRAAAAAGLLMVGALVTACSSSPAGPAAETAPETTPLQEVDAAWLDGGSMLAVVTLGSSTCVPQPGEVSADGQVVSVELVEMGEACTRDLVPRATPVVVPEGVDVARDVTIVTTGAVEGEGVLAGVERLVPGGGIADTQPSAGWTGAEGQFVLLTWGSSSCPPVVEDAAGAGAEVTVTFATPPADQICTADMAPRATVVQVSGVDGGVAVDAVLMGFGYDDVRISIIGVS